VWRAPPAALYATSCVSRSRTNGAVVASPAPLNGDDRLVDCIAAMPLPLPLSLRAVRSIDRATGQRTRGSSTTRRRLNACAGRSAAAASVVRGGSVGRSATWGLANGSPRASPPLDRPPVWAAYCASSSARRTTSSTPSGAMAASPSSAAVELRPRVVVNPLALAGR